MCCWLFAPQLLFPVTILFSITFFTSVTSWSAAWHDWPVMFRNLWHDWVAMFRNTITWYFTESNMALHNQGKYQRWKDSLWKKGDSASHPSSGKNTDPTWRMPPASSIQVRERTFPVRKTEKLFQRLGSMAASSSEFLNLDHSFINWGARHIVKRYDPLFSLPNFRNAE